MGLKLVQPVSPVAEGAEEAEPGLGKVERCMERVLKFLALVDAGLLKRDRGPQLDQRPQSRNPKAWDYAQQRSRTLRCEARLLALSEAESSIKSPAPSSFQM